jgi:predicted flap endonuclease-1-like 5' DNA nuclease
MTALTWEALLLLATTYFVGCCLGCFLRQRFGARARRQSVQPQPQPMQEPVAVAVSQQPVQEPVAVVAPQQPVPIQARSAVSEGTGAQADVPRAARPVPNVLHEPFRRADAVAQDGEPAAIIEPPDPVKQTAEAVARFGRALSGDGLEQRVPAPRASAEPEPEPVAEREDAGPADDLKRIRMIDDVIAHKLGALGVTRFSQIAQWTAADVARINREFGFKGRIQNENWIEQAQVLAKGGETLFSQRMAQGLAATAQGVEDEGEPGSLRRADSKPSLPAQGLTAQPQPAVARAAPEERPQVEQAAATVDAGQDRAQPVVGMSRDNLQRIRGINAEIEKLLGAQGFTRYAQIASWTRVDTERLDRLLGQDGRIARENWIEQAQILSKGGDTAFSRDYDRHSGVSAVPAKPARLAEAMREQAASSEELRAPRTSDVAALRSVKSEALRASDPLPQAEGGSGVRAPRAAAYDDLKRLRGIGVLIEKRLQAAGITAYEQIANWTAGDVDRVCALLELKDRAEAENWVEQARILLSGGRRERISRESVAEETRVEPLRKEDARSAPAAEQGESASAAEQAAGQPAAERTTDAAALRSVKSEALRGPDVGPSVGSAAPNDLKRIRGIGVLIEKKLNAAGVMSYAQIANWTSADIDRMSQLLDFKGRIERENWVEQARILASGGQTEFSRRVDRGEVLTSRAREP